MCAAVLLAVVSTHATAQTRLLRFPDIHGDRMAFSLTEGGQAMRYAPIWSRDGGSLTFSNKDEELYVLHVESKTLTAAKSVIAGRDPQLERAVDEVMRMIRDDLRTRPERPALPVKTP